MTSLLLRLYCVKLLVIHLESRWEKVEAVALAAKLMSGWRHWSDNVLISRPQSNGSHSWKQEVGSAGDSHPTPKARHGPDETWTAAFTSVTIYLLKEETDKFKELQVLVVDFDFSSVVGQFYHVTENMAPIVLCYRTETLCDVSLCFKMSFSHIILFKSSFFQHEHCSIISTLSLSLICKPTGNRTSTSGASASNTDCIIPKQKAPLWQ